jgi:hypothetical protein
MFQSWSVSGLSLSQVMGNNPCLALI